jgi:dihydrofolate reductase
MEGIQVSVYIATSMDGYIARPDGGLDWLSGAQSVPGEDYGYQQFMDTVDTVLLGRGTYDAVIGMNAWPFGGKQVFVLTGRPLASPHPVQVHSGALRPLLDTLARQGSRRVYLDGGVCVRQGLREGVVDDMTISVIPVLLGEGIPLFGQGTPECRWRSSAARQYGDGLIQQRWVRA